MAPCIINDNIEQKPTRCTPVPKSQNFISPYAARRVSDTIVSIIRSFLLLHMQSLVTDPTPHGDQRLHVQQ
jgi:hypothetical protein